MQLLEALNWRYAAKNLNNKVVPADKVDTILEAIRLSASSLGLQPYQVLVVTDHTLKGRIHEVACPQPQIVESSHLLVFASQLSVSDAEVEAHMARIAQVRQVPRESLNGFADAIKGRLLAQSPEASQEWCARQAYLGLGFGLVAAALEQVDSCPMEGFNAAALDGLLGLPARNLRSVALLALGYRDEAKDFLATAKKVRKSRRELFTELS